ncbi:MAG: 3-oxoacyl-[acyl-carrier-protein] reductase [Candidatus Sumerlaeia bacterium]
MLQDKVALITGASRGIGHAIADLFARNGARLALCSRTQEPLQAALKELESRGAVAMAQTVDVSRFEQVEAFVKAVLDRFGRVDILVNNAGITRDQLLMRMSEEDWTEVLDINLKGVFNFCKAVSRPMLRQREGVIVNVSSVVGLTGNAGQVNYAASKAGIIGLTKSLAKELSGKNIRANVLAPGFVRTEMTGKLPQSVQSQVLGLIPMGRMGEPEEIAQAALFLASPMSSYITGQVLVADGGMVM